MSKTTDEEFIETHRALRDNYADRFMFVLGFVLGLVAQRFIVDDSSTFFALLMGAGLAMLGWTISYMVRYGRLVIRYQKEKDASQDQAVQGEAGVDEGASQRRS